VKSGHRLPCIAATALALTVFASPAAQAATQTFNLANCQAALDGQVLQVLSGNDLRITFTSCPAAVPTTLYVSATTPVGTAISADVDGARFSVQFDSAKWRIDGTAVSGAGEPIPVGRYEVYFQIYDRLGNAEVYSGSFAVSVSTPAVTSESTPDPVIQQFAAPASASCDAAAPEHLNWAGVPSGGWGQSWAQWTNEGAGGAVCTRTLVYSASLGAWTLG